MKINKALFFFSIIFSFFTAHTIDKDPLLPFDKVIIWGHKLHTHSHSYIHYGFYKAFKHLGYDTYWFDNSDNVQNFDFSNSLFITANQVDQRIPVRSDCFYILHNCTQSKYRKVLDNGHAIILQVYTHDVPPRDVIKWDDCIYYSVKDKIIYQPWATDLLPDEIDTIKKEIPKRSRKEKSIYYIGYVCGESNDPFATKPSIEKFKKACVENKISFYNFGVYTPNKIDAKKHINLIQNSYLAPSIQCPWQVEVGYIPCRIFKNISYGQFGVTNSKTVYELFQKKIVYNPDPYRLFYDAQKKLENLDINELYELMDFVRDKHTYLNRIDTLLTFFKMVRQDYLQKNTINELQK